MLSGHELLSYSFLGGQACEPRRSIRRKHRYRSSMSLPRTSSSRRSSFKFGSLKYNWHNFVPKFEFKSNKDDDNNSGTPDSELDSGISINGHYEDIRSGKNGSRLDYDRIDEIKTMTGMRRKWRRFCYSFWYLTNFSMTAMIIIMSYWCFVRTTYWWSSYFQRKWRWTWSIGWNIKGKRYLQSLESLRDITEVTWNQSGLSKLYSVHIEQELSSKLLYCGFVGKFREIDMNRCARAAQRILIIISREYMIFLNFLFLKFPWNWIFL